MRIGIGYDIHRLQHSDHLLIGGVRIPYHLGLKGYSDADVLTHSVCDALLGAANLGDIGEHFSNKKLIYKNINSITLLKKTYKLILDKNLVLKNLDATIFAQKPNFTPYKIQIKTKIADSLKINVNKINIKATTTEHLGIIGKSKGIAAMCIVLLG